MKVRGNSCPATEPVRNCFPLFAAVILLAAWFFPAPAPAGVVVLANRSEAKVRFTMEWTEGEVRRHHLEPGDLVPIPVSDQVEIAFQAAGKLRRHVARAASLQQFVTRNGNVELERFAFPSPPGGADSHRPAKPAARPGKRITSLSIIPVKLLVDDDEPAVRRLWEKRLRGRIEQSADIFEHYCRARFRVVAVDTWDSDDATSDFAKSMQEFEREVDPAPARLAIGFTSQYEVPKGRTHMGGTRGALHSHILIREWSQHVTASERLEVLVHELGHFFGAAHSPEPTSVMRPVLGDHRSHARAFRIGFDPVNALAMCLVCEEVQSRQVRHFFRLSPETKVTLRSIYTALVRSMPDDPAARQYLAMLSYGPPVGRKLDGGGKPLVEGTRSVLRAIADAARHNRGSSDPVSGDDLSALYIRRAAAAANKLPRESAAKAFLLGLGIALDDSNLLRANPLTGNLYRRVESDDERTARLKALGKPTLRGRRDLARHFAVSAALTIVLGPQAAESVGLVKELSDAQGGSGFSFADLAADMAGVMFAVETRAGRLPLNTLASSFAVADFMPQVRDLDEGLAWDDFVAAYGSVDDERFRRRQAAIRRRIAALPGYKRHTATPPKK